MNQEKLDNFLQKVIGDLGAAFSVAPIRLGGALGLYAAMSETGATSAPELAAATGYAERYLAEWLSHQAASGYVDYDPTTERFTLPAEHAFLLANPESPAYVLRGFCTAAALSENFAAIAEAFRTGKGVHWGDQSGCLACFIAEFFRPSYRGNLIESWLPALDGVTDRLKAGAKVADIGCGHGHSTRIMAEAFPNSSFIGVDIDAPSIEAARAHAEEHGLKNITFDVGSAQEFDGRGFDFVTCFDALHDMGDPAGAARAIRAALKPDGTWMIVEPNAADRLEDNLGPINRMSYAASTMTCVPGALAQAGGMALGAQAGEARLRDVIVRQGGFGSLRRATETPLNMVLEARLA